MPFDFEEYQKKCDELTTEQLHREWENYTRQIAGDNLTTSTATCIMFSPFTGDVSLLGHGVSGPGIQDARKKREIIEARLQARGTKQKNRKRDGIVPMAVAGTLGGRSLAPAGAGADSVARTAVAHGFEYTASHTTLDSTGALIKHKHDEHSKKAEEKQEVTQAQPQLNQRSSKTKNPVIQKSQQDTPPPSDDEDKVKQWLAIAEREPKHAKVEGLRESVLVKDDLETTYRYLETYILGEEDDDEIPQTPQYPVANQKDGNIPAPTTYSSQVSSEPSNHRQPPTPPPEITQTVALDQPIAQPEGNQVAVHTPVVPSAQVRPPNQTAPVTQGNRQAEGFSNFVTPDMTPPAPVYSEPPVQQSTIPAIPENGFGSPAQNKFDEVAPPPVRSIEEEILWLKTRLDQLEIEKRETATAQNAQQPHAESSPTSTNRDSSSAIIVVESNSNDSLVATQTFDAQETKSEAITHTTSPPAKVPASPSFRPPLASTEYIPPPPPPPSIDQFLRNYVPQSSQPFGKWKRRPERMQFLPPPLPSPSQRPISPGLSQRSPGYPQTSPNMPYFPGAAASPRLQNIPPPPSSPPPSARHQNIPPPPSSPPPNSPRNLPPPPSSPPPHGRPHHPQTSSYPYNHQVFRQASPAPSPSYNPATFPQTQYASITSPASPFGRLSSSLSSPPPYFAPPPPTPPPGGSKMVLGGVKERDYFMQVQELGFGNGRSEVNYSPPPEDFYQNFD